MKEVVFRFSRSTVVMVSFLYGIGYISWRLVLLSPLHDQYWQIQLTQVFGSWFYLPLLPLLVAALTVRSGKTIISLLIPILFLGFEYGRQFLPNLNASILPPDPTKQLRVMSWNTLLTSKVDGKFYDVVEEQRPDIIALQEVGYTARRKLISILGEQYPYLKFRHGKL